MTELPDSHYLEPGDATAMAFMARNIEGPVTMLNLLRFREWADYSADPALAPDAPISGMAAYQKYIEHTLPFLHKSGGELIYLGTGGEYLIGPSGQGWDMAMLIRQQSVEAFFSFAADEDYLSGIGHRLAALVDSRILPLLDQSISNTGRIE